MIFGDRSSDSFWVEYDWRTRLMDYRTKEQSNSNMVEPSTTSAPNLPFSPLLEIVGACPICGSPIYGTKQIVAEKSYEVRRTCLCKPGGDLLATMRTT